MTDDLADRIESEANIAARPGQYDRLMTIAAEVRALAQLDREQIKKGPPGRPAPDTRTDRGELT